MKAIDAVIAISKALDGWDGTPEQAAEKLGAAVAIVKAYSSSPAPEMTTSDKNREEARELWDGALEAAQDVPGPASNGDAEAVAWISYRIARIRAEAKAEALKEAAERLIVAYDSGRTSRSHLRAAVIGIPSDESTPINEWDALTKEEMWNTIQRIRELTGNDGTESPERTVERLVEQLADEPNKEE